MGIAGYGSRDVISEVRRMTGNELYALFGEEEEKLIGYRSGMWDKVNEYKIELFDRVASKLGHVRAKVTH